MCVENHRHLQKQLIDGRSNAKTEPHFSHLQHPHLLHHLFTMHRAHQDRHPPLVLHLRTSLATATVPHLTHMIMVVGPQSVGKALHDMSMDSQNRHSRCQQHSLDDRCPLHRHHSNLLLLTSTMVLVVHRHLHSRHILR